MVVVAPAVLGKAPPVALFDPHRSIIVIVTLHFFSFSFFVVAFAAAPASPPPFACQGTITQIRDERKKYNIGCDR